MLCLAYKYKTLRLQGRMQGLNSQNETRSCTQLPVQPKQRQLQILSKPLTKAALCRLPSLGASPILFMPLTRSSEDRGKKACLHPLGDHA